MKPEIIENHICRFNDGEQTCDCFVEGMKAERERIHNIKFPPISSTEFIKLSDSMNHNQKVKVEQYQYQSFYNDENKLEDCTCGKCV